MAHDTSAARLLWPLLTLLAIVAAVTAPPTHVRAATSPLHAGTASTRALAEPQPVADWAPNLPATRAFLRGRPGRTSFSLLDQETGRRWSHEAWRTAPSASLLKPLLLAAYLRGGSVRGRSLRPADRALLAPMIRRSANAPANALVVKLGADAIRRTARAAGMGLVRLREPWGLTATSARAQVALFAALPALVPQRHRAYAMGLLGAITPSQRWGVGAVAVPGWERYFKGGWGSGTGAVDHQTMLLVRGEHRVVVSILTTGNGSHARGKATLRGVASRLLRGLPREG